MRWARTSPAVEGVTSSMTASAPHIRSVVVHGHFYQPPREDPWLELVSREPSAAPWHDWNERIERECYRTVTAARLFDSAGRIEGIVNTLEWISFNVGPTLLQWMEREAPRTYRAILEADQRAVARTGWGTAIAQPFHHTILPLASPRDRRTEIRWGIADFRRRFGRDPLGMWLPETAVDTATLDALAAEGILFTVLGDHQVATPPPTGRPGWIRTGPGRGIAVFCYDGPLSHDIAFGPLLRDASTWARRALADPVEGVPREVTLMALDGETFGHHHRFGELSLAALIRRLQRHPGVVLEPLAALLQRFPPREELTLVSPSAWSCSHGVERWRSNCGCRMTEGTQQEWRGPLREGLEGVAAALHRHFEREARRLGISDPWGLRDALGEVAGASPQEWHGFLDARLNEHLAPGASAGGGDRLRLRELVEMEWAVLRSFTSCGWFFDDIAGIEGGQVLRYAARALELAGTEVREAVEPGLLAVLALAQSNDPAAGSGADLYRREVLPHVAAHLRVAAGAAAIARGTGIPDAESPDVGSWRARILDGSNGERTVQVQVHHLRTGREWEVEAEIDAGDAGELRVRIVLPAPVPSPVLEVAELPEPQAGAVARALRRKLAEEWLTARDRERLVAGDITLGELAGRRLCRELEESEGSAAPLMGSRVRRFVQLADTAALAAEHSPFDIQTALHRLLLTLDAEARSALEPLKVRLGFSPQL